MTKIEAGPAVADDFETWLNARPKWLQTAARMIIDSKRQLNQDEIKTLARLCKLEAKDEADPGFLTVTPGTLSQVANRPLLRIEEILDVHGLNAIKAGANLPFGKSNLSVIYGQNGTGKSGFARLLKEICGSRSKDEIRSNVFDPTPTPCRAHFKVSIRQRMFTGTSQAALTKLYGTHRCSIARPRSSTWAGLRHAMSPVG